ncbi:MAG: murein transglycosylase A [Snowella sp.]|nr:murein transglycosylase A [Snowella sp.]
MIENPIKTAFLTWGLLFISSPLLQAQNLPLIPVQSFPNAELVGRDDQLWKKDRAALLQAIDLSLRYLNSPNAAKAYRNYPVKGVTLGRVRRSLIRFRTLVNQSPNAEALQKAVKREFVFYQAVGNDNQGTVHFTGYFEPTYRASRRRTAEYRYPLYRKPRNFNNWSKPHPTRSQLEGTDGLGNNSLIKGGELVWFKDRLEPYLVQIQGSAKLQLTDGKTISVSFDGNTDYPYVSLGKELVQDGVFQPGELTLPVLIDYFKKNPAAVDRYIPRNNRFIFFRETSATAKATGSLGVPVIAERSIATDKSLMPPGALAVLVTQIPNANLQKEWVSRYVLDHDTGSAIKGPGRVDIFMGMGQLAGDRAGLMSDDGQLYYLLLKK